MKTALVLGGTGFIGHHLARRLKSLGYFVRVVDIEPYRYGSIDFADEVLNYDLRSQGNVKAVMRLDIDNEGNILPFNYLPLPYANQKGFDEVYQLAADMGGAQYVFSGTHDADILTNSALINLHVAQFSYLTKAKKVFYSSSACCYPQELQQTTQAPKLKESDAYPANPDSDYGFEKLFSERLWMAWARNYQQNVVIARFHNIYGPEGTWYGGKEKAPAAVCRKVAKGTEFVENWGDGLQTRSFLYIDDCIDGILAAMEWDINEPVNIGSEELISIQDLYQLVIDISEKPLKIKNIPMPEGCLGVWGRNSDNSKIESITGWKPKYSLRQGLEITYDWIKSEVEKNYYHDKETNSFIPL